MMRDVVDMMRLRAKEKGLQQLLDQSSDFPRYIRGDEARLRQVLINLVGNAVKYTSEGGVTIRLGTKPNTPDHLLIEVEDTGPGITPESRKRLFTPFVTVAEDAAESGTGLGLTISRHFMELMGGVISVESTPGKGSVFRIELGVEAVTEEEILALKQILPAGEVTGLAPGSPTYRILIAEDQREAQLLLSELMRVIGMEVRIAEDGAQAVRLFKEWRPDLIWMDRRMPVMDGIEATRTIRRLPESETLKIVAVTASVFKEQEQEMLAAGMDGFVHKPYRFHEIYDALAEQLEVEYVYAPASGVEESSVELTSGDLAALPLAMREELQSALENLDSERIQGVIRQIGESDENLRRALSLYADNFDYPAMIKVLAGVQ
jgi:CheY-like chemotaxis protein/anti-sigma regulatory factor (Ser/Thr protein kinase)